MLAGILVGAVIGATFSLLYAPKAGQETRDDLLDRLDDLKLRVDTTARELASRAHTQFDEVRTDLAQAVSVGCIAADERVAELKQQTGME